MDAKTPTDDAGPASDRYEALFGRISMANAEPAREPEAPKTFWQKLASDERYEKVNLVATYVAVFFAPVVACGEMLFGTAPGALHWSVEAARWVELAMGVFFALDIVVGAMAGGLAYLRTPACWINVLAIGATAASYLAADISIANPRVLRVLRTVRAVAKVGLAQKVGAKETVLGAEMLRQMGRDDAWYAVGILLLVSVLGDFSIGQYSHFSDPILEFIIYGALVFAVAWKAERNVERVGRIFMDRLTEANAVILNKMREIPGLEDADALISRRAEEVERQGRKLNEIDTLIEAIGMIIANLRRFISRRAFLEAKGERVIPTRSPVALMFTDVAGFKDLTSSLEKDVLPVLKSYLGEMNRGVVAHGGDIDKFMGEGIFAYFHDNDRPEISVNAALDAAVAMRKTSETLSVAGSALAPLIAADAAFADERIFDTRFGLHWGLVVAGPVGDEERADSTLIGDNVNLAARLEALNHLYGTKILVSDDFQKRLSADRRVLCRRVDRILAPERPDAPMDLYTVDIQPLPVNFLLTYEKALKSYIVGDCSDAIDGFRAAAKVLADAGLEPDPATATMLDRIEAINGFWQKAVAHLRARVPEEITEATANSLAERLGGETWLPPHEWRGYWRIDD